MTTRRRLVFAATALPALAWLPFARAQSAKATGKAMRVGVLYINPAAVSVSGQSTRQVLRGIKPADIPASSPPSSSWG